MEENKIKKWRKKTGSCVYVFRGSRMDEEDEKV
jgi:hypothetical protein